MCLVRAYGDGGLERRGLGDLEPLDLCVDRRGRGEQHPWLAEPRRARRTSPATWRRCRGSRVRLAYGLGTTIRAAMWMVQSRSGCSATTRPSSSRSAMSPS